VGFPIRKFTDQSLFAAPHDLSQRTTSFFASQRQGIHRILLTHLIALIINAHPLGADGAISFFDAWASSEKYETFRAHAKDQFASNAPGGEAVKLAHDWLPGFERHRSPRTRENRYRPKPTGCISSLRCK
jgi:hypothetical protein